jgi:hypothetical protein
VFRAVPVFRAVRGGKLSATAYLSSPPPPPDSHRLREPMALGDARALCAASLEAGLFCVCIQCANLLICRCRCTSLLEMV